MTVKTFDIPAAVIGQIDQDGRTYADTRDLELWLRRIGDALDAQGAPQNAGEIARSIADFIKEATA